jgi:hypothetical protein
LILLLLFGLRTFARRGKLSKAKAWLFATLHTLAHVLPAISLTLLALLLFEGWDWAGERGVLLGWLASALLFMVGFSYGSLVFTVYLGLANMNSPLQHSTEIYGGLASTEYKNFLRFRLDSNEQLTIYPIGIRTCPRWEVSKRDAGESDPWFEPHPTEPEATLIEAPIRVDPE